MTRTTASCVRMTNDWLASQGVLSLKTRWAELAELSRTDKRGSACQVVWGEGPLKRVFLHDLAGTISAAGVFPDCRLAETKNLKVMIRGR
jgi:hypothetical protein